MLGVIDEDTGAYASARQRLEESAERLAAAGDTGSLASARYHLAVVSFGVGDLEAAEGYLEQVLGDHHGSAVRAAGWALHLRGMLAYQRGDFAASLTNHQAALRRFFDADYSAGIADGFAGIAIAAAAAHLPSAAHFWGVADRLVKERGDAFQPPELTIYESAITTLRVDLGEVDFEKALSAGRLMADAEAVAEALALEIPTNAQTSVVQSGILSTLSPRELEVLRLVANGWTNERMGEELFLSPRTIQTHLTNIYRKINVENRTGAVRLAVDNGLLTTAI